MARYKQYENGIFGHKYKGYYIVKDNPDARRSTFSVMRDDSSVALKGLPDFHEADWSIDIKTATEEEISLVRELEKKPIYELNGEVVRYAELAEVGTLTKEQKKTAAWVEKIRNRKSENKPIFI